MWPPKGTLCLENLSAGTLLLENVSPCGDTVCKMCVPQGTLRLEHVSSQGEAVSGKCALLIPDRYATVVALLQFGRDAETDLLGLSVSLGLLKGYIPWWNAHMDAQNTKVQSCDIKPLIRFKPNDGLQKQCTKAAPGATTLPLQLLTH
jgi:hypothetical protein